MTHLLSLGNFYGIDSLIDFLIVIIAILIFFQSNKIYNIIKEKKFKYFSIAFFSIGVAYFFKIISNLTFIYYISLSHENLIGCIHCLIEELETMQFINLFSHLLFKTFLLLGFLTLFLIMIKNENKENNLLLIYFSLVIIILSLYFNYLFYITIAIILFTLIIKIYKNYKTKKTKYSKLLVISFIPLLLSSIIGIFCINNTTGYFIEEIFLFIGFLILFSIHHNFRKKNEKKNKIRSN